MNDTDDIPEQSDPGDEVPLAPVVAQQAARCYLLVAESVYHQEGVSQPTVIADHFSFTRTLASDEQPYTRRVKVGSEWQALDTGWLDGACGMLVLVNNEGLNRQTIPTAEERQETAARVIELGFCRDRDFAEPVAFGLVRPGESSRLEPTEPKALYLRCRSGTASVSIGLLPA